MLKSAKSSDIGKEDLILFPNDNPILVQYPIQIELFSRKNERDNLRHVADEGKVGVVADLHDLLVDHEAEDAELGGTAVVELDGALGDLLLLGEGVPAEVDVAVAEVADELVAGSGDVLHDGDLEEADEGDHLADALEGDGVGAAEGGKAIGEGVEGVTGVVDVSGKVDAGAGDDVTEEGKHGDAAVLDLDVTEAVEALLVGTVEEAEGVEETKGGLDAELSLEGGGVSDGGGGTAGLGGGEGGGGADEGSDERKLGEHDWMKLVVFG